MGVVPYSTHSASLSTTTEDLRAALSVSSPVCPTSMESITSMVTDNASGDFTDILAECILPRPMNPVVDVFSFSVSVSSVIPITAHLW